MTLFAASGPSSYWYLTRATGWVALVLLTASVVFGVLGSLRYASAPRWPRFTIDALHRDVSLLSVVFLVLHIITTVLDGFAPITLIDGVIPFQSPYRPLWLGLGTVSFDLMIALVITSLVRRRLGYGAWRAVHWLAYACWPIAVLHSLGTGTDVKTWWMLLLTVVCVAAAVIAVLARAARAAPQDARVGAGAAMLALVTPVGLAGFALAGPLQKGWAKRAGTPTHLLGKETRTRVVVAAPLPAVSGGTLDRAFSASLSGTASQQSLAGGAIVQLLLRLSGSVRGVLRVRMGGTAINGGGLSMSGSQVDLSAVGMPEVLAGRVVSLDGDHIVATVRDASGLQVDLQATVSIDNQTNAVTGTVSGQPAPREG
jgi:DMSO/TMAO reductase YedYZ heme-binding membrane subunit